MNNFFALIVGVGGVDIPETITDAKDIRDVLISNGAYDSQNTFFCTGQNSTKENIINAFDAIISRTEKTEDSTVFIYYSGHGQRYKAIDNEYFYYLKTYGADENNKEITMLNGEIFSEKVEKIKASRVLVMLDCCYAGGIKKDKLKIKSDDTVAYSNRSLQEKLKSGKGRVFLSSCDDNETSVILPGSKNSLFTEVALQVLNGLCSQGREYVSALDLIFHVLKDVPEKIKPHNHNQNPVLTDAKDLNHKYYVCKNGQWQYHNSKIEEVRTIKPIGKTKLNTDSSIKKLIKKIKNFLTFDKEPTIMAEVLPKFNTTKSDFLLDEIEKLEFIENYSHKI
jgi:hypothetical protein